MQLWQEKFLTPKENVIGGTTGNHQNEVPFLWDNGNSKDSSGIYHFFVGQISQMMFTHFWRDQM